MIGFMRGWREFGMAKLPSLNGFERIWLRSPVRTASISFVAARARLALRGFYFSVRPTGGS
jgi:hypothetical protein